MLRTVVERSGFLDAYLSTRAGSKAETLAAVLEAALFIQGYLRRRRLSAARFPRLRCGARAFRTGDRADRGGPAGVGHAGVGANRLEGEAERLQAPGASDADKLKLKAMLSGVKLIFQVEQGLAGRGADVAWWRN